MYRGGQDNERATWNKKANREMNTLMSIQKKKAQVGVSSSGKIVRYEWEVK